MSSLSYTAIQTSVEILIRLSLDDQVTISGDLLVDIEQSLSSLLTARTEVNEGDTWETLVSFHWVLSNATSSIS